MPVGRKRLTAKGIENLKLPATDPTGKRNGRRFVMDNEVRGLGVKITETGSKSFVMIQRFPGFKHPAPRQLGFCDAMTLEEAREKGREWLRLIALLELRHDVRHVRLPAPSADQASVTR